MATQIIIKNVQTVAGPIVIKALIHTVNDLFYFLKECYLKYGVSLKFLKEFLCNYFPHLIKNFLNHLANEFKNALIGWLGSFIKLFK